MAETNRKNVAWGMAKVEFLPLIPDIKALLALAWPKKAIFNKLVEEQKITMGYVAFCGFIKKHITDAEPEQPPKKPRKRKAKATEQPSEQAATATAQGDTPTAENAPAADTTPPAAKATKPTAPMADAPASTPQPPKPIDAKPEVSGGANSSWGETWADFQAREAAKTPQAPA